MGGFGSGRKKTLIKLPLPVKSRYSVAEISLLFGMNKDTIRGWIDKGFIDGYVSPGSRNRYVTMEAIKKMVSNDPRLGFVLTRIDWSEEINLDTSR